MIKISNIKKIYNPNKANEFEALHDISCEIKDGELVAIIGTSGAGKSTLLHILACIDSYQNGEYKIDDTLVKGLSERKHARIRNEKIGMVMQDFALVEDFTALENVMIPLNFSKKKIKGKKEKALAALKSVGIEELAKKPCNKLSGGQKQRVAIARAIVNEPIMILADEPTGALDTKTSAEIMELFKSLNKQGRTVVIVTHDPKVAEECGRIIGISDDDILCLIGDRCLKLFGHQFIVILRLGLDNYRNTVSKLYSCLISNETGFDNDYLITRIDKSPGSKVKAFRTANGDKDLSLGVVIYTISSLKIIGDSNSGIDISGIG